MSEVTEMTCPEVGEMLPAYARDAEPLLGVRRHLSRCPRCSEEMARYEVLMSSLQMLESRIFEPPAALLESLARIPSDAGRIDVLRVHVVRNRRAYVGGAAALAGAAGAALWQVRRHRLAAA